MNTPYPSTMDGSSSVSVGYWSTNLDYRYNQLERFLNTTAKSGHVNVRYIISEMASLIGLDPEQAILREEEE